MSSNEGSPLPLQTGDEPPLLELAMIARDGGQFLIDLVREASRHVDQVVIGDTGTADGSLREAAALGARILTVPWTDHFAAARNAVLTACRARWLLVLDADERLAEDDWRALRTWVKEHDRDQRTGAGRLVTRNYVPGRYGRRGWRPVPLPDAHALPGPWPPAEGYVPTAKIRLFRRLPAVAFRGRLHETVEADLAAAGFAPVDLPWPVHHYGTLRADAAKQDHYLKLARAKAAEEPDDPQAWSELADAAVAAGDTPTALAAVDRALLLAPGNRDLRLTAGWLLLQAGRCDQADAQLAAVATAGACDDLSLAEACHLRAQIALRQERSDAAGRLLAVALRLFPDNGHFLNTLGAWHLTGGRGPQAEAALRQACALLPGHAQPWLNLAGLYEAAGRREQAAEAYRRALALDPACRAAPGERAGEPAPQG